MSAARPLLLLGGGGHAAVVADAARAAGFDVIGCLDDDPAVADALAALDVAWRGGIDDLAKVREAEGPNVAVHVAVGDSRLRRAWIDMLRRDHADLAQAIVVHPSAVVAPSATLAAGSFVGPGAIINARAALGAGAIVNSGAIVEHDCRVGEVAHLAPRAVLGGGAGVGDGALIGLGAVVLPGVRVGERAVIGAGAVVTTDIPGHVTAMGVPARVGAAAIS